MAEKPETLPSTASLDAIKPVVVKKDTFISNGAHLTGAVEDDGNIVVEGTIEGNLTTTHQVRIEHSGKVKGEIRAQQILINGSVEGRCYAEIISILPKGHMRGDIFTDEFSIEKGGVFVGQSQLMKQTNKEQTKVTAIKAAANAPESRGPEQPTVKTAN
jgi:cytoskeletal protein CcmA (bactofilin family)